MHSNPRSLLGIDTARAAKPAAESLWRIGEVFWFQKPCGWLQNCSIAYGWPNARCDLSRAAVDFKESLGRRQRFGKVGRTGDD